MTDARELFTDAQRGSIGVCVSQLEEQLALLRRLGADSPSLERIESEIADLELETGARRPAPPKNAMQAALSQIRVLEEELRPKRMTAYGDVQDAAAEILDRHIQRLVDLTSLLDAELRDLPPNRDADHLM